MSPKYRVLLALLLSLLAIYSQTVFGQTKIVRQIVHIDRQTVHVSLDKVVAYDCQTGPGSLSITATGGSGSYSFFWTGPNSFTSSQEDISQLRPGTYNLRVTDSGGDCVDTQSWDVKSTCATTCKLNASSLVTGARACNTSDGAIAITVDGGSGRYAYLWYNTSFTIVGNQQNLSNVPPGTYYLQVDDLESKECTSIFYYTVNSSFRTTYTTVPNTVCAPPYTGSVRANVTGGSGDYSYSWRYPDGRTLPGTADLTNATGGNYKVIVRDNVLGCEKETTVYLANTAAATLAVTGVATASTHCAPGNGAVDISVANGTKNYLFIWNNLATGAFAGASEDLVQAMPGSYNVYVLDNISGCTGSKVFAVGDATPRSSTYKPVATANTNCSAPFNGAVALQFSQPGNYDVMWSNGSHTKDLVKAEPGRYSATVKDQSTGCAVNPLSTDYQNIIIEDRSIKPLQVAVDKVAANTQCLAPNGSIQTTVTAQHATVQWTGPNGFTAGTEDLTALDSGTYVLTATVSCNAAPTVKAETLSAAPRGSVSLNLLDIVSDDDGNLDISSLAICERPESGATASISEASVLTVTYTENFQGQDRLRIRACDLLNACSESDILITVQAAAVTRETPAEPSGDITVYNAVAPNSPGNNKFMRIEYLPAGQTNRVSVFNRWGDKVFETENYANDVPGKRFEGFGGNGQPLPSGTYFYKIEFADAGNTLTGYLSLKQ